METITLTAEQDITKMFHPDLVWIPVPSNLQGQVTQGWLYSNNTFSSPGPPVSPTLAKQAMTALAAGVQIKSTGTPALNGTYACTGALYEDMVQEVAALAAGFGLVGEGETMPWMDQSGVQHTITQAQFVAIASAVRNYAATCKQIIAGVSGINALPAQPVIIA
jgi:hypothetical protein